MDSLFVPLHRSVASSSTCSRSDPRKQFHFLRNLPNVSFLRSRVSLPLHDPDLKKAEVSERSSRIVCAVSSTETRYTFYFFVYSLTYVKAFSVSWLSVWLLEKTDRRSTSLLNHEQLGGTFCEIESNFIFVFLPFPSNEADFVRCLCQFICVFARLIEME